MVLFRTTAPLLFYIDEPFMQCGQSPTQASRTVLRWFVIDAVPMSDIDINGLVALTDLQQKLASRTFSTTGLEAKASC
ncbi:MAG: hypothetical protein VXZ59_02440 [Cyanobacteriota bacterium]|nr:hypothetical protein [Cyanobacteriota bacterium]